MSAQPVNPNAPFDCSALVEDGDYRVELAPGVWLMDNHKWALLAWERERVPGRRYVLVHADFHWDGVDDFVSDGAPTKELLAADVDELESMIADDKYIRFDSFIAPAVRRGLLSEVHFFCNQDDGNDVGLDADLCLAAGVQQTVHADQASLGALQPNGPLIYDLCLDLFNRAGDLFEGDVWPDAEVLAFLDETKAHIVAAGVVTISLSFGYSGTEADTKHLAQLVVQRILELRGIVADGSCKPQ